MPTVNFYYRKININQIKKYRYNTASFNLPIYSDESCITSIGFYNSNSKLISPTLYKVEASLSLNNGLNFQYNYNSNSTSSVIPEITYQSNFPVSIISLERDYITDEIRKLTLTY